MIGVPEFIARGPWYFLGLFLFLAIFFRSQLMYWLARLIRSTASQSSRSLNSSALNRLAKKLDGPGVERAKALLERWGYLGIAPSFMVPGLQTMVNLAAGYTRMRWELYTLAILPGSLLWAGIYAAAGWSLVEVWAHSPGLFLAIVVGAAGVTLLLRRWRKNSQSDQIRPDQNGAAAAHTPQ